MDSPISKLTLIATVAATCALAGCSTSHQQTAPASPTTSTVAKGGECAVNPKTEPMPAAEEYRPVPADARISVTMSGIPSGTVKPGDPPAEVDVTLCNNSPVDYPKVGVTTVLTQCSCATNPMGLPEGRIERFDAPTNTWVPLNHPVITTGMDYLGRFTDVQPLPKGKAVTLKYRVTLDPSMTAGKGSVEATAVVPDPLVEIGKADLPFTVLKDSPKETPTPSSPPVASDRQSVLPFTGLTNPWSVAADKDGNVYVSEQGRVVKLAAGSNDQTELPITGVKNVGDVAADGAGNVYVIDFAGNRVLKLAAGSNEPTALPFTGLDHPQHLAVDNDGTVYVTDSAARVVKLPAGASEQTVLPLSEDMTYPDGVAVDGAHGVYIADSRNHRVLKFAAGSNDQTTLSIGGLDGGGAFAVDSACDVFVADNINRQVLKRPAGSNDSTVLPFTGLNRPDGVAVDGAGNVYVIDNSGFGRVVKLAAG
jgi:sugar lactone lactonase YvrE